MNTTKVDTAPLTPEEAAQLTRAMAENPSLMPPKFKTPEELVKAYNELEAAFTRSRQAAPAAQPPAAPTTPAAPAVPETPATPAVPASETALQIDTTPPKPEEVWTSFRNELAAGNLTEATLGKIKALGIPDDILSDALQGIQAHRKTIAQQAAEMAGGDERLKTIFAWAKTSLPAGQLQYINSGLGKTETWQAALSSLLNLYEKQGNPTSGNPAPIPGTRVAGSPGVRGFASPEEMAQAMRDPRYAYDSAYQAEVWQRVAHNMG